MSIESKFRDLMDKYNLPSDVPHEEWQKMRNDVTKSAEQPEAAIESAALLAARKEGEKRIAILRPDHQPDECRAAYDKWWLEKATTEEEPPSKLESFSAGWNARYMERESIAPEYNYWQDVFKGSSCFEDWANNDAFWEKQPYGTRFYFGDGAFDYVNRGVLQAAVKQLNLTKPKRNDIEGDE